MNRLMSATAIALRTIFSIVMLIMLAWATPMLEDGRGIIVATVACGLAGLDAWGILGMRRRPRDAHALAEIMSATTAMVLIAMAIGFRVSEGDVRWTEAIAVAVGAWFASRTVRAAGRLGQEGAG